MKRLLKILKITALAILALLLLITIGLLIFYQSVYKKTPVPTQTEATTNLNDIARLDAPVLLPIPKTLKWTDGHFTLPATIRFNAPAEDVAVIKRICTTHLNTTAEKTGTSVIQFTRNKTLEPQAYDLVIQPKQITIDYND